MRAPRVPLLAPQIADRVEHAENHSPFHLIPHCQSPFLVLLPLRCQEMSHLTFPSPRAFLLTQTQRDSEGRQINSRRGAFFLDRLPASSMGYSTQDGPIQVGIRGVYVQVWGFFENKVNKGTHSAGLEQVITLDLSPPVPEVRDPGANPGRGDLFGARQPWCLPTTRRQG